MDDRIGRLFPAGGPVPADLVIGRTGDIEEIVRRSHEAIHTMLTGPRRIGKTTVCAAVCEQLRQDGTVVVDIEVPERTDAKDLLQLVVDRCNRISCSAAARGLLRVALPLIEQTLADQGIPLDLGQLAAQPGPLPTRKILALPLALAEERNRLVVLFLDELQRAADYADGAQLLGDLVDLYSGNTKVVVLVDGSDERTLDGMLGAPALADLRSVGKLVDRLTLDPSISADIWRAGLAERFVQAGLELAPDALEKLIAFGEGRPYPTMTAARYAALGARKLGSATVEAFDVQMAIDEARRHLAEDNHA
jgi:AAA ATPase domain